MTLNEQNVNDNAPVFGDSSYEFNYDENISESTVIGQVRVPMAQALIPAPTST
ncbi:hypothetical protein [Vibrio harveyi]|uniref:hypothetical protein n=1 Tax=Vibrio harveyi TaxID=669 RepID=UPI0002E4FCD9|nr:hypothetical protein [Vibrio harveyi]